MAVVLLAGGAVIGCEAQRAGSMPGPEATADEEPVCGLIDEDLVEDVVYDAAYETHSGGLSEAERELIRNPAACTVRLRETDQVVLEVSIGVARDPAQLRQQLRAEARATQPCVIYYEEGEPDEPGIGNGWRACYPYDEAHPDGVGVHIQRGEAQGDYRLIRVAIPPVGPVEVADKRLHLAKEIAANIEENRIRSDRQSI